jgi:hypothetical protein
MYLSVFYMRSDCRETSNEVRHLVRGPEFEGVFGRTEASVYMGAENLFAFTVV